VWGYRRGPEAASWVGEIFLAEEGEEEEGEGG